MSIIKFDIEQLIGRNKKTYIDNPSVIISAYTKENQTVANYNGSQILVLMQNEDDTWYDTKGNIVFTCSKGLVGVGVDRSIWETIRYLKAAETYEHNITKSELYKDKKITYQAPFDKCDRVEDYKLAWEHYEKIFKEQ
jgi:hypothetical protein